MIIIILMPIIRLSDFTIRAGMYIKYVLLHFDDIYTIFFTTILLWIQCGVGTKGQSRFWT